MVTGMVAERLGLKTSEKENNFGPMVLEYKVNIKITERRRRK